MAHYKRRKRRKGGIKGCCGMCMLQTTDGRRNGRVLTWQEKRAVLDAKDMLEEAQSAGIKFSAREERLRNGYGGGGRSIIRTRWWKRKR